MLNSRARWFWPLTLLLVLGAKSELEKVLPRDAETGKYGYQEVVQVPGVSAAELYSRARAWVAVAYKSAQDVIQLDDRESGKLICKGNFPTMWMTNQVWIRHLLTIEVKDGRYRFTLTDFIFDTGGWSEPLEGEKKLIIGRKKTLERTAAHAESLIAELKRAMVSVGPPGTDEW